MKILANGWSSKAKVVGANRLSYFIYTFIYLFYYLVPAGHVLSVRPFDHLTSEPVEVLGPRGKKLLLRSRGTQSLSHLRARR